MNDLVIKLDNLLKERRTLIDLTSEYTAYYGPTPNILRRAVLRMVAFAKKQVDREIVATFNKMSKLTDTKSVLHAIRNR